MYPFLDPFTEVPNTFVNESTLDGFAEAVML